MGMFMRVNFTRGNVQEVGFITITCVGSLRVIGLMGSMMGMVLKHGQKGVDIEVNIGMD